MSIMKKLLTVTAAALLAVSCSINVENTEALKEDKGTRGFGKVYGLTQVQAFSDKYFNMTSGYLRYIDKNNIKGYYIRMKGQGDAQWTPEHISTSEAMGYGMRLAAMRIQVSEDQWIKDRYARFFDGLWNVQKQFKSTTETNLHAWVIPATMDPATTKAKSVSSATDGEMDIAYGLLMMHSMYGTTRGINYKAEAEKIILALANTIRTETVNGRAYTYLPTGDWTKWTQDKYVMRASDFMPHHLKTFIRFLEAEGKTSHSAYRKFKDTLATVKYLYANNPFSSAGLFPDFILIKGSDNTLKPLPQNSSQAKTLGEEVQTDMYSYNACRVPWRMAEDTFFTDDEVTAQAAKDIYNNIGGGYPLNVAGNLYSMSGVAQNDHATTAFTAPVAAIIEPAMYLSYKRLTNGSAKGACGNAYWKRINEAFNTINSQFKGYKNDYSNAYYEDSINLFSQYLMIRDSISEPYSTKGL